MRLLRRVTPHPRYAAVAALLLGVEVSIATYVHTGPLRSFVGDVLVVVLIWAFFATFRPQLARRVAAGSFLFACGIEGLQALGLVDRLGLHEQSSWQRVLRIALGATFDPWDFLAYAVGYAACLGVNAMLAPRGTT